MTIVTAADPTLTALSPTTGALGATFQNVYLSGSNFICTTAVLVNGTPLPAGSLSALSSSTFLVVLPDSVLSTLPTSGTTTVTLTFTVEREGGSPQACSPALPTGPFAGASGARGLHARQHSVRNQLPW